MKEKHNRKIIYLAGFLFSIPIALVSYINSSFLGTFLDSKYISIIYIIASILTILGLLKMPKILKRLGNRITILLSLFIIFISLTLLALENNVFTIIIAFILYFISLNYILSSLDVFLEDFSPKTSTGSLRGFYLMIINFAWIIAQIISSSIINKNNFSNIYLLGAGFIILVAIIFIFFLRDFKDPEYKKFYILKTIKSFSQNKNILKIYFSNFILQFFYVWMIIYTPIYLNQYINFSWEKIGIIFSIMLLPFILLDFPLGKLSDKIGEKKMLIIGFSIITLSVIAIPLIKESIFWLWATILFATRVGAATIETMNESYFFKEITKENADEIIFFRNASSLSYVLAPLLAIPILVLVPSFEYLFFVLAVILLIGFLISLKIKDVK
ncbi:MAG: Permeases of the major facilitator superfamily [Candidatus Nomurabacteria bacterium GW2011_GWE1_32_28]|uniref:Permeases of the major facilitator superfamily n=1 Tax=Candidatus Nomurabacteria bacterium GW2011_GWF1_31_48 TaxID=1618767 RepID=A0A0F9YE01_9BACT|nr:MAG: Permeases of the major facilitator superfamily [Candidatus Nomurabacteria bacterium GW2011_GWF2_30_133]KKP28359.1 MAG: Permeases of the major facilitator superfamily [Candidatus Nomurabacteria bacterium GW2011_GWE2_31_40]KKP29944.1 MAG: Permeases of the major facilitator superfamily [Candidatus Nomurabacteria bacterium GW2011_GWF1_31_48]KKP35129.1 MAG: Permeases of the major facilitator superfamily [Candidatus Nomurabacteria bacterium GW2011_GWE1_32_28]HAS80941.1 hypothetical protein [C